MRLAFLARAATAACALSFLPAAAEAATLGFDLTIDGSASSVIGSTNVPVLTLVNTGDHALIGFSLTIGDPAFNFDGLVDLVVPVGVTALVIEGDDNINGIDGVNTDRVALTFDSLQPGQSASFALDVDSDAGVFQQDYRTILFNNGAAENALAEATFASASGPTTLALVLDDQPATDGIARFSAEQAISAPPSVPLPGTLPLALAAIAGFGFLSRRRAG